MWNIDFSYRFLIVLEEKYIHLAQPNWKVTDVTEVTPALASEVFQNNK